MQEFGKEDFYKTAYGFVKRHSATNNAFIDRFARGKTTLYNGYGNTVNPYTFTNICVKTVKI